VAGDGNADLTKGMTALEQALADQGFAVMAQAERMDGIGPQSSVHLRVSMEPIRSPGNGCDVLVYLGKKIPKSNVFPIQGGSALLCEERSLRDASPSAIPEGVITYPVPFADLHHRCGSRSEKGLVAVGVLTHFLGILEEGVRRRIRPDSSLRCFDAGLNWSAKHLHTSDMYTFPPPPPQSPRQVIVNAHQAVALGLAVGACDCGSACVQHLHRSPEEWMREHVSAYWESSLPRGSRKPHHRGVRRSPHADIRVFMGVDDPTAVRGEGANGAPLVLMPADLSDALRLIGAARWQAPAGTAVWIVVDDCLARRAQSVPLQALEEMIRGGERTSGTIAPSKDFDPAMLYKAQREGDTNTGVGFVAWGASQGVVREAVALCGSFGLKVAALYPKVLWPVPAAELWSFAGTVKRLVVVEPNQKGRYTRLLESSTSLHPTSILPEPGKSLNPMDIFLRENLGDETASH
jgi:hypothetical protein